MTGIEMTDVDGVDMRFVFSVMSDHRDDRACIENQQQRRANPANDFDGLVRNEAAHGEHDEKNGKPKGHDKNARSQLIAGEHRLDTVLHTLR